MIRVFSVKGGKYHRPAEPIVQDDPAFRGKAWQETQTACGLTVQPLNYFETIADARNYTGNRLHLFGCKRCGLDK